MKAFLAPLLMVFALFGTVAVAAEPCPPLPKAPELDQMVTYLAPKHPPQVAPPTRHTPMPASPLETARIKLTRAYCRDKDDCELISSVELRGDGAGVFSGKILGVLAKGEHRFPVTPGAMDCLLEAFRAADFWSLAPAYVLNKPGMEFATLEVNVSGQRKVVRDRVGVLVGAPPMLARLELAVEAAGAQSYLVGDANTVPLLQAEHFDFRSRAGAVLLDGAANLSPDAVVWAILAQGAPVNQKVSINGFDDDSAVAVAARQGKLDLVRAMVAAGAFKDAPYQMREDALGAAIEDARPAVVEELIKDGADVGVHGDEGEEFLKRLGANSLSARKIEDPTYRADRLAVIKVLLANGAPLPPTAMHYARTPEEVQVLRAAGGDLEAKNQEGETPLLATVNEDVVLALLEAGANRFAKGSDGKTIAQKARNRLSSMPRVTAWLRAHPVTSSNPPLSKAVH